MKPSLKPDWTKAMSQGEFSVYQFFPDESYEEVLRFVAAKEAMLKAEALTFTVGAKLGTTASVIITDGGDYTCFEWQFGKGITFPIKGKDY